MIHTINYLLLLTKQKRLTAAGIMLNNGNTPNMIAGFPSPIRKQYILFPEQTQDLLFIILIKTALRTFTLTFLQLFGLMVT